MKYAVQDDVTHIAILHVDSFPISSHWVERLAGMLSEHCVLAAIGDQFPNTACMFFHRDFHLKYRPTFHLSREQLSSQAFKNYLTEDGLSYEFRYVSGIGYGFTIYREGLTWYPLARSNRAEDDYRFAGIFADLIFHLVSANRLARGFAGDEEQLYEISKFRRTLINFRKSYAPFLPDRLRLQIDNLLPRAVVDFFFPQYRLNDEAFRVVRERLLSDPEAYLDFLRSGKSL